MVSAPQPESFITLPIAALRFAGVWDGSKTYYINDVVYDYYSQYCYCWVQPTAGNTNDSPSQSKPGYGIYWIPYTIPNTQTQQANPSPAI